MNSPAAPPLSNADAQALWREGGTAYRAGDPAAALRAYRGLLDSGRGDAAVWFGVAMAQRLAGDEAAMLEALDKVLAVEPRNIRALMMKGDHYAASGDAVAAASFYWAVARLGAETPQLPPDLIAEVRRAEAAAADADARFEAHLKRELAGRGLEGDEARRVRASLDLMFGRAEIFPQKPVQYYFPELPQVQFYDRRDTPWLDGVDAATDAIRDELLAVLAEDSGFGPYVEDTPGRPFFDRDGLRGNPAWSAFYLVKSGAVVAENAARCPRTMAALSHVPLCRIPERTPSIFFSLLRPGMRIPPHHGLLNTRLICHLPLVVPPGCGFRVGSETRVWREGRAWAFDDSIEHEAWNESDSLRVVLIFDVWRPELTAVERELVGAVLQASPRFQDAGGG